MFVALMFNGGLSAVHEHSLNGDFLFANGSPSFNKRSILSLFIDERPSVQLSLVAVLPLAIKLSRLSTLFDHFSVPNELHFVSYLERCLGVTSNIVY